MSKKAKDSSKSDGSGKGSTMEAIPSSPKKFRKSPEIEGFYRFVFENDLQREASEILEQVILRRKAEKTAKKKSARSSK